jgi:hypothetical protein
MIWDPVAQIRATFEPGGLQRAPHHALSKLGISQESRRFLSDVGVPNQPILLVEFAIDVDTIPTLREFATQIALPEEIADKMWRIGTDGRLELVLTTRDDADPVLSVDPRGEIPTRLVNTSVDLLVGFLALYVEYCRECPNHSDEEMNAAAASLEVRMRQYDPPAFESREQHWSTVLEQMKVGLL